MSDLNDFKLQGIVCNFDDAITASNIDNEEKAYCRVKMNVQTNQKGADGKYITKMHELYAFRKSAVTLANNAKPGTGLVLEGYIGESRPKVVNGQQVMTADGKKVYTGSQLIVSRVHFQRDYSKANGTAGTAPAVASSNEVDPMTEMFGSTAAAPVAAPAPAPAPAATGTDGFDFGNLGFPM